MFKFMHSRNLYGDTRRAFVNSPEMLQKRAMQIIRSLEHCNAQEISHKVESLDKKLRAIVRTKLKQEGKYI